MTVRRLVRSLMLLGVFLTLLGSLQLFPDPCSNSGDDCCSSQSATTNCGTTCCAGIQATPEVVFQLDLPIALESSFESLRRRPDSIPLDPLVRPPIAACPA